MVFRLPVAPRSLANTDGGFIHRLAEVATRKQRCTEQLAQCQENTDHVLGLLREATVARAPLPDAKTTAHQLLTKLTAQDDIEAYLHTFEVVVTRELWDKAEWPKILAPLLSGEAQQEYYSLLPPANDDYEVLKREILAGIGLSPVSASQQFHQWAYEEQVPVRAQATQLTLLEYLWLLTGEPSATQVAEKVVIDRLLRSLPRRFRTIVSMRGPTTIREVVKAVELAEDAWRQPEGTSRTVCRPVRVDGHSVTATLDSGSSVTLVQPGIVRPRIGGKAAIPIICVYGDTPVYRRARYSWLPVRARGQRRSGSWTTCRNRCC